MMARRKNLSDWWVVFATFTVAFVVIAICINLFDLPISNSKYDADAMFSCYEDCKIERLYIDGELTPLNIIHETAIKSGNRYIKAVTNKGEVAAYVDVPGGEVYCTAYPSEGYIHCGG